MNEFKGKVKAAVRRFTEEFKRDAVRVNSSSQSVRHSSASLGPRHDVL